MNTATLHRFIGHTETVPFHVRMREKLNWRS